MSFDRAGPIMCKGIGQLKQAVAECMQNRNQVNPALPCNQIGSGFGTASDLIGNGFLRPNFVASASYGTVTLNASGAIEMVGTASAGACTVTFTPLGLTSQVTWTSANAGGGCSKSRTGFGT